MYYDFAANNSDTVSPLTVRMHLQETMVHLPNFVEACAKYNNDSPLAVNRNFVGLRAALIVTTSNHPPEAPALTAGCMGFSAATKALSDMHEDIRSLQAQMCVLLKATGRAKAALRRTLIMGQKPSTTAGVMECAVNTAQVVERAN